MEVAIHMDVKKPTHPGARLSLKWMLVLYGAITLLWLGLSERALSPLLGNLPHLSLPLALLEQSAWIGLLSLGGLFGLPLLRAWLRRRHSDSALDELPLRHFYEQGFIAMAISAPESRRWLKFNDRLCTLLGYSRDELRQMSWDELTHPQDRPANLALYAQVLKGETDGYRLDKRFLHKDGQERFVTVDLRAQRHADGRVKFLVAMIEDISERKRTEEALRRQQALYNTLSHTNQTIVWTTDRDTLFANVCRIAVQHGGFRFAWIGLFDEGQHRLEPVERFGDDAGYLALYPGRLPADPQQALARHQICNDLQQESVRTAWQPVALAAGIRAWGAFPIRQQGQVVGTLNLYSDKAAFFTSDVLDTLDEMAMDVSFALDNLARESERLRVAAALQESQALFQALATVSPVGIFRADHEGHCRYINARGAEMAGLGSAADAHACWLHSIHEDDRPLIAESWPRAVQAGATFRQEFRFQHADGTLIWVMGLANPERDEQGRVIGYVGTLTDITSMHDNEVRLSQAAAVFENTHEGIMVTDAEQRILMVNQAFSDHLGYSDEEVLGQTPALFNSGRQDAAFYQQLNDSLAQDGHWRGEIWNRCRSGELLPQLLSISTIRDAAGRVLHYVCVYSDISKIKATEAKLEYLAKHDPLTQLPNRSLLNERLEQALAQARQHQQRVALLILDLDRFKDINDSFGHAVGDRVLQQVGERIAERLPAQCTLSRLGGDEFTLVQEGNPSLADAERLATAIIERLQQPLQLPNGRVVVIGASVGISLYPEHGSRPDTLLQQADTAMYRAKADGKGRFRCFCNEMTRGAQERLALEADLRQALEQQQFSLHYQPQMDIASGRLVGAEALLRWHHPERGMVPPDRFIPIAEESGLINPIGEWVLNEACRQGRRWLDAGLAPLTLAVNLSSRQLRHGDIAATVAAILAETGYPARLLELELTESALIESPEETVATLERLREQGVRVAIDDFGTGYSSLAYLKRFPLDVLKIDKRFVDDIPHSRDDMEIAAAIVAMAHSLRLKVMAEGVETESQLAFLQDRGCDGYQGYLKSKPLPANAFSDLLAQGQPLPA